MAQVLFAELMESYDDYCAWVKAGRMNEDHGDDLLTTLTLDIQGYFFDGGEVDEGAVMHAITEENLRVTLRGRNTVGITLPVSPEEGDEFIHWVTQH